MTFKQVVHSDRTEETGVIRRQIRSEGPNEHPQECPVDAPASRGNGSVGASSKAQAAYVHGVSAKIVARWVERYKGEGRAGMVDRSSRPHRLRSPVSEATIARIVALRRQRRTGKHIAMEVGVSPARQGPAAMEPHVQLAPPAWQSTFETTY